MSPLWPRTIASRIVTVPEMPEGIAQWGQSGKGQFRAFDNTGRTWQEVYSAINLKTANGRALMAALNRALREKTVWDIRHPHYTANFGTYGGTPLINGAGQTGNSIIIDGADVSVTNWARDGDLIKFAGLQLLYDVIADANSDSGGNVTLTIHPPIFVGQSPANNAVVSVDPGTFFFKAVVATAQMPDIEADGVMFAGLTIQWREQPS